MREAPEVRTARSLKKEYDMWRKYEASARTECEIKYYKGCADRTAARIDWSLLNPRKNKVEEEKYYE